MNLWLKSNPAFYFQCIIKKIIVFVRQCERHYFIDTQAKYVIIIIGLKSVDLQAR